GRAPAVGHRDVMRGFLPLCLRVLAARLEAARSRSATTSSAIAGLNCSCRTALVAQVAMSDRSDAIQIADGPNRPGNGEFALLRAIPEADCRRRGLTDPRGLRQEAGRLRLAHLDRPAVSVDCSPGRAAQQGRRSLSRVASPRATTRERQARAPCRVLRERQTPVS